MLALQALRSAMIWVTNSLRLTVNFLHSFSPVASYDSISLLSRMSNSFWNSIHCCLHIIWFLTSSSIFFDLEYRSCADSLLTLISPEVNSCFDRVHRA